MLPTIAIIGLGYVGLPLAYHFSKMYSVVGFDVNKEKIALYKRGRDITGEVGDEKLVGTSIRFTHVVDDLKDCNVYIIAVPTPINTDKTPNLIPLECATELVSGVMKKGDYVVYESTVYPGLTEEYCQPILERVSGLVCGSDFKICYSPERINPGDKIHSFENIVKVVSGCDQEAVDYIAEVYASVVKAGVFKATSIKVAEAAKVIENTQRDINIAFVNELSILFNKMNISMPDVLEAANTKWNFLPFRPGLVGGHCIGVDPYYLTYKAQTLGYHPEMILSGRRINDGMGKFIAESTIKLLIQADRQVKQAKVLILGFTFKENVADVRNTKVVDIYSELREYEVNVDIYDDVADAAEANREYGIRLIDNIQGQYDAVILAVTHNQFQNFSPADIKGLFADGKRVFVDVKSLFSRNDFHDENDLYWSL